MGSIQVSALERGLFCPVELDDPEDIPMWGTSRRSTSPTSGGSERHRTRGTRRRRCPIWQHRPPPRVPLARGGPANATAGPEPPRDKRLVLGDASTPRMRFSSSNGLGDVSTALWSVILSNPEKSGLAAIHSVAKEAILKGESR